MLNDILSQLVAGLMVQWSAFCIAVVFYWSAVVGLVILSGFTLSLHQENMSVKCVPPQTPLLYSKTGVCMGIPVFLIFSPKHRLWVLVRTALARQF